MRDVGAVDIDIVDDKNERLQVVRDLLLCNNGEEEEGERECESGEESTDFEWFGVGAIERGGSGSVEGGEARVRQAEFAVRG
jgi:hypothetical protein